MDRVPRWVQAVYQSQGGIVAPERAIQAHVKAALAHGAILKEREPLQVRCRSLRYELLSTCLPKDTGRRTCVGTVTES